MAVAGRPASHQGSGPADYRKNTSLVIFLRLDQEIPDSGEQAYSNDAARPRWVAAAAAASAAVVTSIADVSASARP